MTPRIDSNVILGPWPLDDHPSWAAGDIEAHLRRFRFDAAIVRHSTSITYDAATGNRRLLGELAGHKRLLPAFVLGPTESGEHGHPESVADDLLAVDVAAVWLYPRSHGWSLDGPESSQLLSTLRRAALPVFIDLDESNWSEINRFSAQCPELDIVVCGVGYRTMRQAFAVLDGRPRVHVDMSYLAALDGPEIIVRRYGADRIVFGSGAPVRDSSAAAFVLDRSNLANDVQQKLVTGVAASTRNLRLGATSPRSGSVSWPRYDDVIDAHGHLGRWPSSWIPHPDPDALISSLHRAGISHALVSHMEALWGDTARGNASVVESVRAQPHRLSGYLVANPHHPEHAEQLSDWLNLEPIRGIKVHPDCHACGIDDPRYRWVWELAEAHRTPVLCHGFAGNVYSDPQMFGSVAERYPSLTLLVGHSGATPDGFRRTIEVARVHQNLVAEICGSWMTGWWLGRLIDELGATRVVHGTDACLIDPRYSLGRVLGGDLDDQTCDLILSTNARRIFRLPPCSSSQEATNVPRTNPHH